MPYSITTRERTSAPVQSRGRKRAELPDDVVTAVQSGVDNRDQETVIGPFTDEKEAKKLWGSIRARLRDESFGPELSARGGVAASTDGSKFAVIFSVTAKRAKRVKATPEEAPATASESVEQINEEQLQPV